MKVLVLSPILPQKNNIRIDYVNSVVNFLKSHTRVKVFWLIYQPKNIIEKNEPDLEILDIHNFSNGIELIKKIKPDLYFANPTLEPINAAISLASISHNIPIICFDHSFFSFGEQNKDKTKKIRLLFLNKLPSDSESEKKLLSRLRFYVFKFSFLIKTRISTSKSLNDFLAILKDTVRFFSGRYNRLNPFGTIYLMSGKYSLNYPQYKKIKEKKPIEIVGNPYWDDLSRKIRLVQPRQSEKIRILVVTDSLYEHGIWTFDQRNKFLSKLFQILDSDGKIIFDIKIHPSSENIESYQSLLKKLKISAKIFQLENLWEIAKNYDMFITYGYSQAHAEIAYGGKKTILLNTNAELPLTTLVKEGIEAGHIKQHDNDKSLLALIHNFHKEKTVLTDDFKEVCSKFFAIADGTSSEKIGKIILKLLKNNSKFIN